MIEGQQITDGEVLWEVTKFFDTDNSELQYLQMTVNNLQSSINNAKGNRSYNTEYDVGAIVKAGGGSPSYISIECIQAGKSAEHELNPLSSSDIGTIIEDNTIKWLVFDNRDGTPVGAFRYSNCTPPGYVKANGSTVDRVDYPRLVQFVNDNNLWTDFPSQYPGLFGRGDGVSTMVLPDFRDRVVQLIDDNNPGKAIEAGLPNITGSFTLFNGCGGDTFNIHPDALFNVSHSSNSTTVSGTGETPTQSDVFNFDASKANQLYGASETVQPPAVSMIPLIRY